MALEAIGSSSVTTAFLAPWQQQLPLGGWGYRTFTGRPVYHALESVTWNAVHDTDEMAGALEENTGVNMNKSEVYTNKGLTPPLFNEALSVNPYELMKTPMIDEIGVQRPEGGAFPRRTQQALAAMLMGKGVKLAQKTQRAMEYQVWEILKTGKIENIPNPTGGVFSDNYDFKPLSALFPTVATAWSNVAADGLQDILNLCRVGSAEGGVNFNRIILNGEDWEFLQKQTTFKAKADVLNNNLFALEMPRDAVAGGSFHGVISVGQYRLQVWTYDGRYTSPGASSRTEYLPKGKVVLASADVEFTPTFGEIPRAISRDPRLNFLPRRIIDREVGFDMSLHAWPTQDGSSFAMSVGTRGLVIPKQENMWGALDVQTA